MNTSSEQEFDEPESPFSDDLDLSSTGSSGGPSKKKRTKRSAIHDHFLLHDGRFKCNYCSTTFTAANSTSACLRHIKTKHNTELTSFQPKPTQSFSKLTFQDKLVNVVVMESLPFSFVESKVVEDLFRYCNPDVELPSRQKLKVDIIGKYENEKDKLKYILHNIPGKICCITDNWTSSNMYPYQGVIVQYIDKNWELCSTVLDLTILEGSHTGTNMADALIQVLTEFNVIEKLIAITTDNASNNMTMIAAVSSHLKNMGVLFDEQNNHIRCFAHIVNLACVAAFDEIKKTAPHNFETDIDDEETDGISLIAKLRGGIKSIRKSTVKRELFRRHCVSENTKHNELLIDVKTRWNSTYYMIKRCLKLKVPYTTTLLNDNDCVKYVLTENEISILELTVVLLKPFKTATKDISNQNFPTISLCALLYVELFEHLEIFFPNDSNANKPVNKETQELYPEWLQIAAEAAWQKLNNYYPTSDGLAYVIGSVMDPRCKLQWFTQRFKPDIVKGYKKSLTAYWNAHYKPKEEEVTPESSSPGKSKNAWTRHLQSSTQTARKKDELEVYLSDRTSINAEKSALEWWKLHEDEFPNLAKMARDFLAISGSGVPVECLFSNGPDLLRNRRKSLSNETVRKCICLKLWLRKDPDLTFGKAASEKMTGLTL